MFGKYVASSSLVHRLPRNEILSNRALSIDTQSGIEASEFAPERFLASEVKFPATNPNQYAFGFGRRYVADSLISTHLSIKFRIRSACPGRYLAENSLFLFISWLMSTVTISPVKDDNNVPTPPQASFVGSLVW